MAWGGKREGSGRKPKPKGDPVGGLSPHLMQMLIEASGAAAASKKTERQRQNPFRVPAFPPGAIPRNKDHHLAMDDSLDWAGAQWGNGSTALLSGFDAAGLAFPGYPFLAELAQRPEYRIITETIATEMTRKWIKIESVTTNKNKKKPKAASEGEDEADAEPKTDKADKIKQLTDYMNDLQVRDRFCDLARVDGFFGRAHLFLDFGTDGKSESDEELKTPVGDFKSADSLTKMRGKKLSRLQVIEPVWSYPTTYNATNPLLPDWYNPQVWYVMGKEVHRTRLLTFIGRPVPDLLKPAYSFGGLSLSQISMPYVDIWLQTRSAVAALIHSFSVMVLMTDLATMMQPGNGAALMLRAQLFNALRDNQGLMMVNKATEDFKNVSASMAGLHELQAQAMEHMAFPSRIPIVKFTGDQPSGLNASSEGAIRIWYDMINAFQPMLFGPNLDVVFRACQVSRWGEVDPDLTYKFESLWALSEKEEAELRKIEAETDDILVNGVGAISPEEVRNRVANDPGTPYAALDPEDVPEPPEDPDKINLKGTEPFGGKHVNEEDADANSGNGQ